MKRYLIAVLMLVLVPVVALAQSGQFPGQFQQPYAGAVPRTLNAKAAEIFSVDDFGAKHDTSAHLFEGSIVSGSAIFSSANYTFTSRDIGKIIQVDGAGAVGATLRASVSSINGNAATLSVSAGTTVSNVIWVMGSDDTLAIKRARDAAIAAGGGKLYYPCGIYSISDEIVITSNAAAVSHEGCGPRGATILLQTNPTKGGLLWDNGYGYISGGGLDGITIEAGLGYATTRNNWTKAGSSGVGLAIVQVINNGVFQNFAVSGFATNLSDQGSTGNTIAHFLLQNSSSRGYAVNTNTSYATSAGNFVIDGDIINSGFSGDNSDSIGFDVGASGGARFYSLDVVGFKTGCRLKPASADHLVQYLFMDSVMCDTNFGNGWELDATNALINSIFCTKCWGSYNGGAGMVTKGANANFKKIEFVGGRFQQNVGPGIDGQAGEFINFVGGAIVDNSRTQTNVYPGVALANGLGNWKFVGVRIGNDVSTDQAEGIKGAGSNAAILVGNDFTGPGSGKSPYTFGASSQVCAFGNFPQSGGDVACGTMGVPGVLYPTADNTYSIGTSTLRWLNEHLYGSTYYGSSSGSASVSAQASAGTPTIKWPTQSGTVVTTTSSPFAIDATTGAFSCPGCSSFATGTNAGNLTGTLPCSVFPALTGAVATSSGSCGTTQTQMLLGATASAITSGATMYIGPAGAQANVNQAGYYFAVASSITELRCASANAPGSGETYTVNINKNGSNTGTAGTISGSGGFETGVVAQAVSVAAGDMVTLQIVTSAAAASSTFSCYMKVRY